MTRSLTKYETQLLTRALIEADNRLNPTTVLDLAKAEDIAAEDTDWHHIRLSYEAFPWKGAGYRIIADWSAPDLDGCIIELLVLGDKDCRPYELEIRRPDLRPILHLPSVEAWTGS